MDIDILVRRSNLKSFSAKKYKNGKYKSVKVDMSVGARQHRTEEEDFLLTISHHIVVYGASSGADEEKLVDLEISVNHFCTGLNLERAHDADEKILILRDNLIAFSASKINSMTAELGMMPIPPHVFFSYKDSSEV